MSGATFAEQLRAHRAAAGLTQVELAERAGISERAVSDIERGLRRHVYAVTARSLADALGLDPADAAVFEAAARPARARSVTSTGPVWGTDWRNLRRTSMLGRETELDQVLRALIDESTRLLTITGTGGVGKSRLAAEVCWRLESDEPGRVVWVPLAGLLQPDLLLVTVATALGVSAGAGEELPAALARVLDQRSTLLVLDTFERLLDAAPALGAVLDRATHLRVLVTSRAPLRVRGESELPLHALPEPVAAELFRERARSARPGLSLQDGDGTRLVADICRRVAGVPLALELAASRVRHMPLHLLRVELGQSLHVLTDGERDLPERQRTMRSTISWSHDLLGAGDKAVFRGLAAFAGGWTLDAAEQVCAADRVLAAISRLCEHGLVEPDPVARPARWHLLDPIHEYAVEQLAASPEADAVVRRHAEFYAGFAATAAPLLLGSEQAEARKRIRSEVANMRAALGSATQARGDPEVALRVVGALWMFWRLEGAFEEGWIWTQRTLELPGADDSPFRANALWGAAWLSYQRGDVPSATAYAEELLKRSTSTETALDRRNALTILGHVAIGQRRFDDALSLLEEALELARASNASWHIATSLLNLGTVLLRQGDPRHAVVVLEEAVAAHDAAGDRHFVAHSLIELGYAFLIWGKAEEAAARFAAATRTFLDLEERWGTAEAVAAFAVLASVCAHAETAAVLAGASEAAYAEMATRVMIPDAELGAPFLAQARGVLGETEWRRGVQNGQGLSVEEAAQLALRKLDPAGG
ncbi:MAG: tetratricopeptide repeat protein [Actinomycetota bacterium]|nr:tetratricopeptide repeat protein [Actinomycetota bacterium]